MPEIDSVKRSSRELEGMRECEELAEPVWGEKGCLQ